MLPTAISFLLGLLPLMFETSTLSFYVAPIAVTLCFGLGFATLLVLVVIPALILILESQKGHAVRLRDSLLTRARPYVPKNLNWRSPS